MTFFSFSSEHDQFIHITSYYFIFMQWNFFFFTVRLTNIEILLGVALIHIFGQVVPQINRKAEERGKLT